MCNLDFNSVKENVKLLYIYTLKLAKAYKRSTDIYNSWLVICRTCKGGKGVSSLHHE